VSSFQRAIAAPATRTPPSRTVLVVEDDAGLRAYLAVILEQQGYEVIAAGSGEEALAALGKRKAMLAVLDIGLPGMDGLTVARRLSQDPDTADIPIVFLTAMGTTADQLRGYEAGGVDYLTKPFSAATLVASVRRVMDALDLGRSLRRERVDQVVRLQAILALEQQR
jgi:DNA-binding response OmpR family regulator